LRKVTYLSNMYIFECVCGEVRVKEGEREKEEERKRKRERERKREPVLRTCFVYRQCV